MTEASQPFFRRLVILVNPNSTQATNALALLPVLRTALPDAQFSLLSVDMQNQIGDWLAIAKTGGWLGPHTLLAVAAGDGTINHVAERLLCADGLTPAQRRTVLLPLWGGNANDLARMLNGMPSRTHVRRLVRRGHIVPVRPIRFELQPKHGKPYERFALCYASFGASAAVARVINQTGFRQITRRTWAPLRFGRELLLVIKTLSNAPRFRMTDPQLGERKVFERVFINGSRLAKVERVALNLTSPHFYEAVVTRMRLGALFSRALELSDRRFADRNAQTNISFVVHDGLLGQFDGEDQAIKAGTTVHATVHGQPFYALSLRLRPPAH